MPHSPYTVIYMYNVVIGIEDFTINTFTSKSDAVVENF